MLYLYLPIFLILVLQSLSVNGRGGGGWDEKEEEKGKKEEKKKEGEKEEEEELRGERRGGGSTRRDVVSWCVPFLNEIQLFSFFYFMHMKVYSSQLNFVYPFSFSHIFYTYIMIRILSINERRGGGE